MQEPDLELDPWCIREEGIDLDRLAWGESIFALSNGHLGLRGNFEEGEPFGEPGTYLSGVHERRPLPYAEAGYGFPEAGQTVINVTNGKIIRLLVDDEPFDVRYGSLLSHVRKLDLRTGLLERRVEWRSPAGQDVLITTTRLVSLTQRAIAAIRYEVEPVGDPARIVVQSELIVNEPQHEPRAADPRVAAVLRAPLTPEEHSCSDGRAVLVHRARRSGLRVAAGMDHLVESPAPTTSETECRPDLARHTVSTRLEPGQRLTMVKLLGYGWSSVRSTPAVRDQVVAALTAARASTWDGLVEEQREFLGSYWNCAEVTIEGDPEVQVGVRYGMFQVLQASARSEGQAIAAKGLTGTGYDGHSFWDSEAFVVPLLSHTYPPAARHALRWRHSTLPAARERAHALRLGGASFPWRTIAGEECSGYWPAGTAAFHVNAAVAAALVHHVEVTGDEEAEAELGVELLVETARLWRSLGHHAPDGCFHIDGVTGPDEYSAIVDDNVYTNLMAQLNLHAAAAVARRHPERAEQMGVTDDEIEGWIRAADTMYVAYDDRLGVHSQDMGFTQHERWDFEATPPECYPLFRSFPYFDLYRKQVAKQADLVLAMERRPELFDLEQKARNFEYYEALTVRDSSLSASSQAVVAAELGHLDLAWEYLAETALIDLRDLHENASDGLHIASSAGAWMALTRGIGGMKVTDGALSFAPRLPSRVDRVEFGVVHRGSHVRVLVERERSTYRLESGDPIEIRHHGEPLALGDDPVDRPNPPAPQFAAPRQPKGREPRRTDHWFGDRSG